MTSPTPPPPEATGLATRHLKRGPALALTAVTAVLLTACTATPAEDLESWWGSGGRTHIRTVSDDAKRVSELVRRSRERGALDSTAAALPACKDLRTHVAAAEAYDPIPDKDAQSFWSSALGSFRKGASDCIAGSFMGVMEIETEGSSNLQVTVSTIRRIMVGP
ncbi:hypothetical protein ACQEVG_35990 [Streptomyces sp. CA-135486]|uniref:hypothetical protein n=1 Tax=Streptomyces sp. CA-135486 TaxID=3240049 RepID=UPI003D8A82A2